MVQPVGREVCSGGRWLWEEWRECSKSEAIFGGEVGVALGYGELSYKSYF